MSTDLQMLFDEINSFDYYPANVDPICGNRTGNIFFPGGTGLIKPGDSSISNKNIMIVSDQFNTTLDFNKFHGLKKQRVKITPAYLNLLEFMIKANIDAEKAFFTNTLLGIEIKTTGKKSSTYINRYFVDYCKHVFRMELEIQKPKLVIVFGLKAAKFLSTFHPKLEAWSTIKSFKEVDEKKLSIMKNIPLVSGSTSTIALLVHPAVRQANIAGRKFGKFSGNKAEIEMMLSLKTLEM